MPVQKDPRAHPSKLTNPNTRDYVNARGLSRKHIFDSVKASLERLDTDYIDVLQCHRFDDSVEIPEIMDALHDVVQSGKVRYIGMSSCYAWQFHAMQAYARENKKTQFISLQDFYCAVYREEEREAFPTAKVRLPLMAPLALLWLTYLNLTQLFGMGIIPWSPLARGYLTRPWKEQNNTKRAQSDPNFAKFVGLGNEHEESALQSINEA